MSWAVPGLTRAVARLRCSPELIAKRHAQPLEAEGIRALETRTTVERRLSWTHDKVSGRGASAASLLSSRLKYVAIVVGACGMELPHHHLFVFVTATLRPCATFYINQELPNIILLSTRVWLPRLVKNTESDSQ